MPYDYKEKEKELMIEMIVALRMAAYRIKLLIDKDYNGNK